MKQNEIVSRQNRVVYILLVVIGALGLTWAIWQYNRDEVPARHTSHRAAAWLRSWALRPLAPGQPGARA